MDDSTKNFAAAHIEIDSTLAKMARPNRSAKKWASRKTSEANGSLLNAIHQEIYDAKPAWEKEAIQKDLDELAGKTEDVSPYVPPPLPVAQEAL